MTKLKDYKMFIDGEWVDSESKKTFETLNPENNEPWATVTLKLYQQIMTQVIDYTLNL